MTPGAEQPSLLGVPEPAPSRTPWPAVAAVAVESPLPHLDRTFDYGVPASMLDDVAPGVRVKVRFAGREKDGYVLSVARASQHAGELAALRRVVSPLPVLTPEVLALCRAVADRYAGTLSDVLRLAVPPRHATAEAAALASDAAPVPDGAGGPDLFDRHDPAPWDRYRGGSALLRRLAAGESPRAVWAALPGPDGEPQWPTALAAAVAATRASGRGALVVVPDARDLSRLVAALEAAGVDHVALSAEQGRSARYRRFVLAATGRARVVVGTRAAALAPVADLGLVACWDDGDDLLAEPRAPYPHVREVLTTRADLEGTAAIVAGYARTPAAEQLVADGWAVSLRADRDAVRAGTPRVVAPSDVDLAREGAAGAARFPRPAWEATRAALRQGPVLVQVPRAGYLPVVACARCRTPSRCRHCAGPLALPARDRPPECRWCGRRAHGWACRECGGEQVRAVRVGSARTAEELGRAFPGVLVRTSGRDGGVLDTVEGDPALVVATPGAEPVADGGYAAAVLLDASVTAGAAGLDTSAEGLRRWLGAASLVRADGTVVLLGNPPPAPAQALVRWDPVGYAQRELAERSELDFPPLSRLVSLAGPPAAVRGLLARADLPDEAQVLGPQPVAGDDGVERVQSLVRVPRDLGAELARALRTASAVRSAHKEVGAVRVQVDPVDIG